MGDRAERPARSWGFADDSVSTMGSSLFQMAMGFCSSVLVARVLGPEGRGQYTIAMVFAGMLVMLVDCGIGMASVYYMGQRKYRPDQILGANTSMSCALGALLTLGGFAFIPLLRRGLFPAVPGNVMVLALLMVPGQVFLNYMTMMLLGFHSVGSYNLIQVLRGVSFLGLLAALLALHRSDVGSAIIAHVVSLVATSGVLFCVLKRKAGGISLRFPRELLRSEVGYGLKTYAGTIGTFLHQRADVVMLNWWTSAGAVGTYSVAAKLAEETWLVSRAAATVLLPRVSSSVDGTDIKELTPQVCRTVLVITLIGSLALALPARLLITLLFSDAFAAAADPLRILLAGTVILSASRILQTDLAGRGRPGLVTYIVILTGLVNVGLNIILIPHFGIIGSAWSTTASYTLAFGFSLIAYRRISGNRVANVLMPRFSDLRDARTYLSSLAVRTKSALNNGLAPFSHRR